MKHLTDDIIQEYLDSGELANKRLVESHSIVCPECQDRLESYREIYLHLTNEPVTELDERFNNNVLKLVDEWEFSKKLQSLTYSLAAVAGLGAILFMLNYFNILSMSHVFAFLQSASINLVSPLFEAVSKIASALNGNLEILAFAVLAMLLFELLDYGLVQHKVKRT